MVKLIVFGYLVGSGSVPMEGSKFYHEYNFPTMEMCQNIEKWHHDSFPHIFKLNSYCAETTN